MFNDIDATLIQGRTQVIDKAMAMIEATQNRLFGQGEDLDWIEDAARGEEFERTLSTTLKDRNVTLELIAYGSGQRALDVARRLEAVRPGQVEVFFKKHGHARVLVSDGHRILLAFRRYGGGGGAGDEEYIGLYLESTHLANWLAERHLRLRRSEDARPLDERVHALAEYESVLRTFEVLVDSKGTMLKTIEFIANATSSVRIAGQQIDWITESDAFREQIADACIGAKTNGAFCFRVLAAKATATSRESAKQWRTRGFDVRLAKDYGQTQYVVVDGRNIVIALPMEPTPKGPHNPAPTLEFIAFCATDQRLAKWLETRFDYLWDNGRDLGLPLGQRVRSIGRLRETVMREIKSRAVDLALGLIFFALGYIVSMWASGQLKELLDKLLLQ